MNIMDYLTFQNPEVLAMCLGAILFIISFLVIQKFMRNKLISMIISIIVGLLAGWNLYNNRFYDLERPLAFCLILAMIGVLVKLIFSFVKRSKRGY